MHRRFYLLKRRDMDSPMLPVRIDASLIFTIQELGMNAVVERHEATKTVILLFESGESQCPEHVRLNDVGAAAGVMRCRCWSSRS